MTPQEILKKQQALWVEQAPSMIYDHKRWAQLIEAQVSRIHKLAEQKGGEYAGDTDRLANFRRNGAALGVPMELVWAVYAGKHWDAVQQYVKDLVAQKDRVRAEPISGRVDDLIVYLILLQAILEEREGPKDEPQQIFCTRVNGSYTCVSSEICKAYGYQRVSD